VHSSVAVLCQFDKGNIGKKVHGNAVTECSAWYPLDIPGASGERATHNAGVEGSSSSIWDVVLWNVRSIQSQLNGNGCIVLG